MPSRLICHLVGFNDSDHLAIARKCELPNLTLVVHTSLESFAAAESVSGVGCVVAPLAGHGERARAMLERLKRRNSSLAVVLLAEQAEVAGIVAALRGGAEDVLDWPVEEARLTSAIEAACVTSLSKHQHLAESVAAQQRLAQLTSGEREVLNLMLLGKVNKSIGARLGIALRTVENRRKQIFTKLGTRGFAEIVRIVQDAERLSGVERPSAPLFAVPAPLGLPLPMRVELSQQRA